ncbi:HRDC domain-containing protein [Leucobacter luti]|uniref:Ribonuclease D n=1 Tax=Leucobacter luti TaxID=340320 RepID=A0A4Q7TLE2_9MICO|nr:HRDC domain-containing protein [Leucobacter luti]MBL3700368.1 ribonuclease D [Leucobacter luti]RZT60538.1 ribonuclease D [Leucobacter luti]
MVEQSELETEWSLIADDAGLARAAALLADASGPIGVDAERASGFTYGSEAYLVQVYRRGVGPFLFDPTGITDFSPLAAALDGEEWILHAASQDIPCLDELGLHPDRLFDTELAARLLGYERVGLGAIVEQLLDIHLDKAHSAADWSQRPLPESWLEYAALDVALLPDLRDAVAEDLDAQGKWEFAQQEFEAVRTRPAKAKNPEPWRKLSGGHSLKSPRTLALARELWESRDALARERDVAPGRLIPDSSVVAAAAANPRSKNDLARLPNFRGRASRTEIDRWWKAILAGKTTTDLPGARPRDPDAIPHHRGWAQRHPEAAERLAAARAAIEAEAERQGIPVENLLTPDHLRRLVWRPPADTSAEGIALRLTELGARDWQVGIVAPIIAAVFVDLR